MIYKNKSFLVALCLIFTMQFLTSCLSESSDSLSIEESKEVIIKNADASSSVAFFTLHIQSQKSEPKICSTFIPKTNLPDTPLLFDGAIKVDRLVIKLPLKSQESTISFDTEETPTFSFEAYESYSLCAEHDGEIEEDRMVFMHIGQTSSDDEYLGSSQGAQARFSSICIGCKLTGDLTSNSFNGANLSGSTLDGAILPVNLDDAIFDRVDFSGVATRDASKSGYILGLVGVSLNGSSLKGAKLPTHFAPKSIINANFSDVDFGSRRDFRALDPNRIKGVDFRGAKLRHASFQNLNMEDTNFDASDLSGASFDSVVWSGANSFKGATTQGANFTTTVSSRPDVALNTPSTVRLKQDFSYQDLSELIFTNANFSESNFSYARNLTRNLDRAILDRVDFTGVAMSGVSLNGSSLKGVKIPQVFSPRSINGVNFESADFGEKRNFTTINPKLIQNANFKGAKLIGANFEGLTIEGCNFDFTDLSGANFSGVTFRGENSFLGSTMDEQTKGTFAAKAARFTKPSPELCSDKEGTWVSTVGECSATRAIAKRVCLMPTKEDWLEIFASCGANTYHSSGYASNFDNCMMSKHFANPGSDTYTSSYWTSSDANSKESWEAGYGGNIWGIGVSSQYNRDTGWIRCVR